LTRARWIIIIPKLKKMARKGTFVTFEGGEGSGKSTHIEHIVARLRKEGQSVILAREPGGTELGERIRHVLQYDKQSVSMTPETELLLFCASRAQLVREVILPAIKRGQIAICDRFFDSTTVYQGVGRQLDPKKVAAINAFAIDGCLPDLTLVIDLDPRVGLERVRGRELFDRMENQSLRFYQRVRRGYLDLAKREPKRVKVIDGSQSIETISNQIWELIQNVLHRSA